MTSRPSRLADLTRWIACGAVVVFAHASAAALVATWSNPVAPGLPAGAITIDLAPLATSTAQAQDDIAPGPPMREVSSTQPRHDSEAGDARRPDRKDVDEKVMPRTPDAPKAEVVRPAKRAPATVAAPPRRTAGRQHRPKPARPSAPATTAPPRAAHIAALAAAPAQGQTSGSADALPSWKSRIVAAIERNKRYPAEAEAKREHGTPFLSFSIDRRGRLLSSRLVRTSGVSALDQEALAILRRAQPFPPAPAEIAGSQFNFTIPIRFTAR